MVATAIALNRFGLGARVDEPLPADPRAWLLGQFDRFEARPAAIAALPGRREVAGDLANYMAQVQSENRGRRRNRDMPQRPAAMRMDPREPGAFAELPESARRYLRRGIREHYMAMNSARLDSALTSRTPFLERLTHFWANHFAVSADKLPVIGMAGLLEFEAIRPNLMGKFADMLIAVEQHPAMLVYLDQAQSIGPESRAAQLAARFARQRRGLNENLAREVLELHTLGVKAGYTQADVTELARALTGWTISGLARGPAARLIGSTGEVGSFHFAEAIHQPGERHILGRRYAQHGEAQARAVLLDLAAHPATARHLATKLARHFAGDEPPPAMVERLAQAYLRSGGDLPSLYRALVESPEVWIQLPAKFKSPWEWSVSTLRAVGSRQLEPDIAAGLLNQLGQPTWRPGSPAGWDDLASSWAGPDALVRRVEVAERIAARAPANADARVVAERVLPGSLGAATRTAIARAESPQQGLALLLVSPEFLRR